MPRFANDCIACEVGDTHVSHYFTSPENTQHLFQSNLEGWELKEYAIVVNENGDAIGEKGTDISSNGAVRIFWTENGEFWIISAPFLETAHEFEKSEDFHSIRLTEISNPLKTR